MESFFLFCVGADSSLIKGKEFAGERKRLASTGVFVFLTAVFAFIFSAFCISTINEDPKIYLSSAILWSIFIFCLDRQIIMSMRKTDSVWKQILQFIPRIIISVFIGIFISKPVELWIFNSEIKTYLERNDNIRINSELQIERTAIELHNGDIQKI